jgi:putative ergosteryl-3beta-O-L-aspartate hydrolase
MSLGMFFHRMAPPRPPGPAFTRVIPSTISSKQGNITLNFYVPIDYETQQMLWTNRPELDDADEDSEQTVGSKTRRFSAAFVEMGQSIRRRSTSARRWGGYPVVLNFHGGGFTLGSSGDDARWCGTVVDECHAVVVSVDYRLAPEHPFPTAVEDGVDAVLYVFNHAKELGIDKTKIALSGFSSGGNMAFTVPLRLYDELQGFPRDDASTPPPSAKQKTERALHGHALTPVSTSNESEASSNTKVDASASNADLSDPTEPSSSSPKQYTKPNPITTIRETTPPEDIRLACIVPWYPPVDYTRTREQRRATGTRPDQELPAIFTDLFDESYLHPPNTISLDSPYLSPGVASSALLKNGLPDEIIMHTCEWDMLLAEGAEFKDRLISDEIGKNVFYKMIENVPHGWDKAPNPWKPTPGVREHYLRACKEMRRVLWPSQLDARPAMERQTTKGYPTAAPRGSVQMVR